MDRGACWSGLIAAQLTTAEPCWRAAVATAAENRRALPADPWLALPARAGGQAGRRAGSESWSVRTVSPLTLSVYPAPAPCSPLTLARLVPVCAQLTRRCPCVPPGQARSSHSSASSAGPEPADGELQLTEV